MKLQPYLYFDGNCREAFAFYQELFGGEIATLMTYGERPEMQMPPEWNEKILHATLKIGDEELLGADAPGNFKAPAGFEVAIAVDDAPLAKRLFEALADGGSARLPFQEVFWGKGFGMVTDKFGVPWLINCS